MTLAAGDLLHGAPQSGLVGWGGSVFNSSWNDEAFAQVELGAATFARRQDGTLVAWGYNGNGACNVPELPAGVRYVGVARGPGLHALVFRSDGVALSWGYDNYGQCQVPPLPPGLAYVDGATGNPSVSPCAAIELRWVGA